MPHDKPWQLQSIVAAAAKRAALCTAGFAFARGKCLSHPNPILGLSGFFSIGADTASLLLTRHSALTCMAFLVGPHISIFRMALQWDTLAMCLRQEWLSGLISFALPHARCCCELKGACVDSNAGQHSCAYLLW